jgi:hypothetical protein
MGPIGGCVVGPRVTGAWVACGAAAAATGPGAAGLGGGVRDSAANEAPSARNNVTLDPAARSSSTNLLTIVGFVTLELPRRSSVTKSAAAAPPQRSARAACCGTRPRTRRARPRRATPPTPPPPTHRRAAHAPAKPDRNTPQRITPVCPSEYRPGWGQTQTPCGPRPTGISLISLPVRVLRAYTAEL